MYTIVFKYYDDVKLKKIKDQSKKKENVSLLTNFLLSLPYKYRILTSFTILVAFSIFLATKFMATTTASLEGIPSKTVL